jgi:pimeloyl-ACP methyl ester carboxylesterase
MMFFLNHGFRVIAHDRRGHGRSTGSFWPRSACQSTRSTKRDQR